jgi:hypothetical protein
MLADILSNLPGATDGDASTAVETRQPVAALTDRIASFLTNDDNSYDWRSASAIAKALNVSESDVASAVQAVPGDFRSKQSIRGKGLLIQLA